MYWHVENVMKTTSLRGAEWQVLVAIAHRANESGLAGMSHGFVAELTGLSRRHVKRIVTALSEAGHLVTWTNGAGRAARTYYQLHEDLCVNLARSNGDIDANNGDIGDTQAQTMGTSVQVMGTLVAPNGDIGDTYKDLKDLKHMQGARAHEAEPPPDPERDALARMESEFEDVFGIMPVRTGYVEEWQEPLLGLLRRCDGDVRAAFDILHDAYRRWQGRVKPDGSHYAVKSPASVVWAINLALQDVHLRPSPPPSDSPIPRIRRALEQHGANLEQWDADLRELAAPFDWSDPKFALASLSGQLTRSRA